MDLPPDTLLHNRYRIQRLLGKGGMGAVYLAHDESLEHEVAVKINFTSSPETAAQFKNEARLLATLRHPNLPRVIDYFIEGEKQFLVMDYIPGDDLKSRITQYGPVPLDQVLRLAQQLGSALSYLHRQNPPIFHRDVKPANLKLSADHEIILVDFGITKAAAADQQTAAGAAMYLTPGYAPPEQYGRARTGTYSDQYSLAATLYNLLTAQAPADSVQRLLGQAELIPLSQLDPTIPANVQGAIDRGMALRPEDRFTSVDEFIHTLCDPNYQATVGALLPAAAANLPPLPAAAANLPPLPPPTPGYDLPLSRSEKPKWPLIAGIISLVIVVGGAILLFSILKNQNQALPPETTITQTSLPQVMNSAIPPSPSPLPLTKTLPPTFTFAPIPLPTLTLTPTSQPTAEPTMTPLPTLPPLGKGHGIAFASNRGDGKTRQIWLANVNLDAQGKPVASGFTQLTFDAGDKSQPAWSPDGTKLLYVAPGGKASNGLDYGLDLFLLDLGVKDSQPVNLTQRIGDDTDPAWSPDGKWIALTNNGRGDKVPMIDIMKPDGSGLRRVSVDLQESNPTWSPDMNWLGYVMFANDLNILYLRDITSDYAKTQPFDMKTFIDRTGQVADPAWSPDGAQIAYTRMDGSNRTIYTMLASARADKITKLTVSGHDREPAWSPDSQWVIFTSERDGNTEVYIMNAQGQLQTNLSNSPGSDMQPAWRP
ncbi:MAG TPA: protein kinase [Anaerolineaceae bacterium]